MTAVYGGAGVAASGGGAGAGAGGGAGCWPGCSSGLLVRLDPAMPCVASAVLPHVSRGHTLLDVDSDFTPGVEQRMQRS
jgi:hypothetical protein